MSKTVVIIPFLLFLLGVTSDLQAGVISGLSDEISMVSVPIDQQATPILELASVDVSQDSGMSQSSTNSFSSGFALPSVPTIDLTDNLFSKLLLKECSVPSPPLLDGLIKPA